MSYVKSYLENVIEIAKRVDHAQVESMIQILLQTREKHGRLFILGVGGSAANCTHAVNDFRKIAGIESYAPVDNVAELTARTNDEGWHTVFVEYLRVSRLNEKDVVMILSVGGGNKEKNVSANLVHAMELAQERKAKIIGIVGRDGGYTGKVADACVIIPTLSQEQITPQAEAWQGVIWHMIVSDPRVMTMSNKWESIDKAAPAR
jgi:D-sedoheptulose 7-phosphate isomerase